MSQEEKSFLNLAGEFAVASELNRRHLIASVTYGASKSADVFVLSSDMSKIARIEVKATDKEKWPIGDRATILTPKSAGIFWVLVKFPCPLSVSPEDDCQRGKHAPRFFVLTAKELHEVWKRGADEYCARYRHKNGKDFIGRGVPNVAIKDVLCFEAKWERILSHFVD